MVMNLRAIYGAHDARAMGQYFFRDIGAVLVEQIGRQLNDGLLSYEEAVGIRYDMKLAELLPGERDHETIYRVAGDEVVVAATRADLARVSSHDPTWIEAFPARFRPDMTPRIEKLLGIDRTQAPDVEAVCHLLTNRDAEGAPIQGMRYAVRRSNGARPQAFVSATFSADKSISIAWGLAEPGMKTEIRRAHQAAVETALQEMEGRIGRIRLGPGGKDGRERGEMGWITFFHTHGRLGDPQIHSHVAILKVVASRESERVGSVNTRPLRGQFDYFRGVYHRALAENLKKVGLEAFYDLERKAARIDIPERVVEAFSKRKQQILEAARATAPGFDKLSRHEQIQIARKVRMATRPPKDAIEVGVGNWRDQLVPLNWNPDAIYQVAHRKIAERAMAALREPERRAFGLRMPDGGYHVGGAEKEWGLER